jgi:hypothetical protein
MKHIDLRAPSYRRFDALISAACGLSAVVSREPDTCRLVRRPGGKSTDEA